MNYKLILFIWGILWACIIGDEPKGLRNHKKPFASSQNPPMERWKKKQMATSDLLGIDKDRFMVIFKRQSKISLEPCLRRWRASPFSVSLTATLEKNGSLSHIKAIGQELPVCAELSLKDMDFKAISSTMSGKSILVYWKVDW